MYLPDTTTYTEFRENLASHIKRIKKTNRPTVITQNGKAALVVLNLQEFGEYAAARERAEVVEAIRRSRKDFAEGRFMEWSEAKKLLLAKHAKRMSKAKK